MSTINERVDNIIKALYKGNKRAFATFLGVAPTVIENIVGKRQGNPSYEVLVAIYAKANISADWLLLGEGPMFRNEATADHIPDAGKMVSTGKEAVGEPSDNGLTDYLRAQNDDLRARITQLERQNAVLEYRLEHSGEDK